MDAGVANRLASLDKTLEKGFAAMNKNLADIARSLRSIDGKLPVKFVGNEAVLEREDDGK